MKISRFYNISLCLFMSLLMFFTTEFETNSNAGEKQYSDVVVVETQELKDINIKNINASPETNDNRHEIITKMNHLAPDAIWTYVDFVDKYIPIDLSEGLKSENINQLVFYEDITENKAYVFGRAETILYKFVEFDYDGPEFFKKDIKIITTDCKKIIYDETCSRGVSEWMYLSLNGELRFFNYAPSGYSHGKNVFGEGRYKKYFGETVLDKVDDAWMINNNIFYIKNNNLYRKRRNCKTLKIVGDCGEILDVTGAEFNNTFLYVNKEGKLFGIGKNINQIIRNDMSSKTKFKEPQEFKLPFNVKRVCAFVPYKKSIMVVDENNNLYLLKEGEDVKLYDNVKRIEPTPDGGIRVLRDDKRVYEFFVSNHKDNDGRRVVEIKKIEIFSSDQNYFNVNFIEKNNQILLTQYERRYFEFTGDYEQLLACWWIDFTITDTGFYSKKPYLVSDNVTNIAGRLYSNGKSWMLFDKDGEKKRAIDSSAGKIAIGDDKCYYIKNGNLFLKDLYKSKKNIEDKLFAKNVSNVWAYAGNVAYVKNGYLYSYGDIEELRWVMQRSDDDDFELPDYPKSPPHRVKYTEIKGRNVFNVTFDQKHIYIVMKSGKTYKILPKQKDGKVWFRKQCAVKNKHLMKFKNVTGIYIKELNYSDYTKETILTKKNNTVLIWKGKYNKTKVKRIKNVKKYLCSHNLYGGRGINLVLKKNGTLYGWGDNTYHSIDVCKRETIAVKNKVKISKNVVDMSLPENRVAFGPSGGIFYLTQNNELYFKGYNGDEYA